MRICYNGRFKEQGRYRQVRDPCNRESADVLSDVPRIKLCGESMSACHTVCRSNCFTIDQRFRKRALIVGGSLLGSASWDRERNRRSRHRAAVSSSVELPIVVRRAWLREGLRRGRSSRLIQGVRAFILLAHPVHDEHDHQYRAEQTYYRAADHSWK